MHRKLLDLNFLIHILLVKVNFLCEKTTYSFSKHFFFFPFLMISNIMEVVILLDRFIKTGPLLATGYLAPIIFGHFITVTTRNFGTIYHNQHP